jgi:predicted dinucleotide-binding enzyme
MLEQGNDVNISIIGSGHVGGTLGIRWARNGHRVAFSTHSGHSEGIRKRLSEANVDAAIGSVTEVAADADVLLLATPWSAVEEVLASAGNLIGKIVVDATNPLLPDLSGLSVDNNVSAGELVAKWAVGATVVKAFNSVGFNIMDDPSFAQGRVAMFYCGDDQVAKTLVASLIDELGFQPLDAGPLTQARVLEQFALLWISLAIKNGYGREIAFQLLQRDNK